MSNSTGIRKSLLWTALAVLALPFALQLFGFAQPPRAQRVAEIPDLTGLNLEELLEYRLYTASRHLVDPRKAPAVITVIGSDEIRLYGWRTLADLLRSVPGIYTASSPTDTYIGVRGFLQPGDFNTRILLLIDGHRINDNFRQLAAMGTDFPLDLSLVDHVEVLRGAGSSLYGTNAELAVVNVLTRRPEVKPTFLVGSESGSFLERKLETRTSFRPGMISGLLEGSIYRENGPKHLEFAADPMTGTPAQVVNDEDGDRYSHLFGRFRHGNLSVEGLFSDRDKLIPGAPAISTAAGAANRNNARRGYLDAAYNGAMGDHAKFDIRAYYDFAKLHNSTTTMPGNGDASAGPDFEISTGKANWLGLESVFARQIGRNRIVGGAQGEFDLEVSQVLLRLAQGQIETHHIANHLAAIFGETELNIGTHLSLSLGGREDWGRNQNPFFSPRIAGMYLWRKASLKYIYTEAFRGPEPAALFCSESTCTPSPQTALKAEHTRSGTATFSQQLFSHLNWAATGYQNEVTNLVEKIPIQSGPAGGFTNSHGDRSRGLEFEVAAVCKPKWSARTSYAFNRAYDLATGSALERSPKHMAKFNGTGPVFGGHSIGLELQYNGLEFSDFRQRISPIFLANTTFLSRSFLGGMRFSASCFDCLDRSTTVFPGPSPAVSLTPGTARVLRFRIEYRHTAGRKSDSP